MSDNPESLASVLRGFFYDKYRVTNLCAQLNGDPNTLLRDGEEIDMGQRAQIEADIEQIMERLADASTPENTACPRGEE